LKREAVERGEEEGREKELKLRKKEVGSEPTFGHTNNSGIEWNVLTKGFDLIL